MRYKTCFKCQKNKPLDAYYKHKRMGDGHLNKCIECAKKDVQERYLILIQTGEWKEKEQLRGRVKYHRYKYKTKADIAKKGRDNWIQKYPEKVAASKKSVHKKLGIAKHIQVHHWSYAPADHLDIIQLTISEHKKAHRFLIYDQPTMKYKTTSGILLDTKEKHEAYIREMILTQPD